MPDNPNLIFIEDGEIVLILTSAEKYLSTTTTILKSMLNEKGYKCLYVTINRPYKVLVNILKKNGILTENIFFIDLISRLTRTAVDGVSDCLFIESPDSLTELSIAISESVKNMPGDKKLMFLDSLSTLLVYNQSGTVTKFAHFLFSKMKTEGVETIILSLEKEMEEKMTDQIAMFVDKVIRVNGE